MHPRIKSLGHIVGATAAVAILSSSLLAQTLYTWNNSGASWTSPVSWTPGGGPPGSIDTAKFTIPTTGAISNPNLNSAATIEQLILGNAPSSGWTLTGAGSLATGANGNFVTFPVGVTGLITRAGAGDFTIDLGNGSATSLGLSGFSSITGAGLIGISSSSRLILTGNTIAVNTNTNLDNGNPPVAGPVVVRGGTLVLDNSAGNPAAQRFTSVSGVFLIGGGSTLELRGAAAGTSFTGISGGLSSGTGDAYLRLVQSGNASLTANFNIISRTIPGTIFHVENIGTGFVGDVGKPIVTANTAPNLRDGVLSVSATTTQPWALVTNRVSDSPSATVTGRWATYSGGIVAATTTTFTGDFGGAAAGTNVLFTPTVAGTVTQTSAGNQLGSVVFEPTVAGVTYDVGSGNQINTFGIAVSGANDISVTGGNLFLGDATGGTRTVAVLNPTTSLITNSNLANTHVTAGNAATNIGGPGFTILTGNTNQIDFAVRQSVNLNGGVLRVTSSNFVTTNATISYRGGVLEYDVSGGNTTFDLALGSSANQVFWSSSSAASSGELNSTNVGSGGFSAYAGPGNGNGNSLTVNLGGAGAQVNWNDPSFVAGYYALKFGSLKSNATVVFQNPIGLVATAGTGKDYFAYQTREINVVKGVGNAADKTQLTGVISGTVGYDLIKTGTGVLETTAANTYEGNTVIKGGELRVSGVNTGGGAYVIDGSGTLSGVGTLPGTVSVLSGGTLRGDSGSGTGTLATGGFTVQSGGQIAANIGATSLSSDVAAGAGIVNLIAGSSLRLTSIAGFSNAAPATWDIATLVSGSNLLLNGVGVANGFQFGTFVQGTGSSGPVTIDTSGLGVALAAGDAFQLSRAGNNLVLSFSKATGVLGDYNGNGIVDAADYVVWRKSLGGASLPNEGASLGIVDAQDYTFWKSRFGATSGLASAATVPEPASLLLLLVGLAFYGRKVGNCRRVRTFVASLPA